MGACAAIVLSDIDRYVPLDLRETPGPLTQWRIRLLAADPQSCLRVLGRSKLASGFATPVPARNGCGYSDGVAVKGGALDDAPVMRCPLAAAFASWERHVVQPAAERLLKARVTGFRHFGAYACRDIAGRPGRRSQHATGNAIDVAAFELSDGSVVSVADDWPKTGPAAKFLREVRDGACGLFAGVLSPDWNEAHRDHFHLDLGRIDVCR